MCVVLNLIVNFSSPTLVSILSVGTSIQPVETFGTSFAPIPNCQVSQILLELIVELARFGKGGNWIDKFPSDSRIAGMGNFEPSVDSNLYFTEFIGREKFKDEVVEFTADHLERFINNRRSSVLSQ